MCKRDEDIDFWSENVQIQPCTAVSSNNWNQEKIQSINLSGSDSSLQVNKMAYDARDINNERIDHMDW